MGKISESTNNQIESFANTIGVPRNTAEFIEYLRTFVICTQRIPTRSELVQDATNYFNAPSNHEFISVSPGAIAEFTYQYLRH